MRPSFDNGKSSREWGRLQATSAPGTTRNTRQLWLVVDNATYESQFDAKALVASFPTRPLGSDPVSTYTQNGDVLFQLEHYEEALTTYEKVLQLDPQSSTALRQLGELELQAGEYAKAAQHLKSALKARPDDATAAFEAGQALEKSDDLPGARDALEGPPRSRAGGGVAGARFQLPPK